ncbi:MAG: carbohydrate ABC transporter permease [Armatimonadetes bacterium]|nr:carbohydrate ABC transporter permease [Armatimonadota bacterium]
MAAMEQGFESLGFGLISAEPPKAYDIWTNYRRVNDAQPFGRYLLNSAIVATSTTIFCLLIGSLCGYAVARLTFPGRDAVLALILAVSMFPPIAVVSPLFLMLKSSGLLNSYWSLILPYTAFGLPLTIWTLTSFFRELPRDLEESARVDGCTRFQAFHKIILPLAAPGVFTSAILVFIGAWNEFLFSLVFVTAPKMRTVPVGITMYPGQFETPWGTIFAAATLVTLPLVVVVFLFQKRIISGLTAGAVKG